MTPLGRSVFGLCVIATLAGACRSRSTASSPAMQTYDGTVAEVITQLATHHHVAAVVDPSAHELASCARVRVTVPGDMQPAAAVGLLNTSVRAMGLRLSLDGAGWNVSRDPSIRMASIPRECRGRVVPGALGSLDPIDPGMRPDMPAAPPVPSVPPTPFVAPADAGAGLAEIIAGVHQRSDTEFDVTRRAVDSLLENQATLMSSARIIPSMRDGAVTGVRMYGIRPSSVMRLLGFQNGDELQTINGLDVSSPERALEAYSRIRSAPEMRVGIVRRGAPMEIVFHVR